MAYRWCPVPAAWCWAHAEPACTAGAALLGWAQPSGLGWKPLIPTSPSLCRLRGALGPEEARRPALAPELRPCVRAPATGPRLRGVRCAVDLSWPRQPSTRVRRRALLRSSAHVGVPVSGREKGQDGGGGEPLPCGSHG